MRRHTFPASNFRQQAHCQQYIFNFIEIYSFIPVNSFVGMDISALLFPVAYNAVKTALHEPEENDIKDTRKSASDLDLH